MRFTEHTNRKGVLRINLDGGDIGFSYNISLRDFDKCFRLFGDSRGTVIHKAKDILMEYYLKAVKHGSDK